MPSRLRSATRRDDSPPARIDAIAEGVTVGADGAVWAWVELPTRCTDELNTETTFALTTRGAADLRRILPKGQEFCVKIQWSMHSGAAYAEQETARLGDRATPEQLAYIALGARRIDDNRFPQRQVLLGVHLPDPTGPGVTQLVRAGGRRLGGDTTRRDDAADLLRRSVTAARTFHERMAASSFAARPATVAQLAWSLRRDLRRTVDWLPAGALASAGEVARLRSACRADIRDDHLIVATDTGPQFLRILTVAQTGMPAVDLELPGGEWLQQLTIASDDLDAPTPVPVEVCLRGVNLSTRDARKRMSSTLALVKEQYREAAEGAAEDPPEAIAAARATLPARIEEVSGGSVGMVVFHPRWILAADTLEELDRQTTAVIDHYGGRGIDLWIPHGLQDLLYKESVLGDTVRFADCEQFAPMQTLVGGWFHGGSRIGAGAGPVLGGNVGSTPGPFRHRFTDAALAGDPVTTVFTGQSGGGKSTALMLCLLGELILNRAWGALTDFKGDLHGIVEVAHRYGVRVTEVTASEQAAGSMDPFRYVPDLREAASRAVDNLQAMLRPGVADAAEPHLQRAASRVAAYPQAGQRSTHAIIGELCAANLVVVDDEGRPKKTPDLEARRYGEELRGLAEDPLALPLAGEPDLTAPPLPTGPGLVYMRYDNLRMPSRAIPETSWRRGQRLSMALVRGGFAYLTYMAHRVRGIPKLVALTELHLLSGFPEGKEIIGDTARLGRALDVSLLLDTQAAVDLIAVDGLLDQVSATFCFRVHTAAEADAQAALLGQTPEPIIRARQLGYAAGECCARVGRDIASVAFDYMSADIARDLSTTPERDAAEELEEALA